MEPRNIPYQRLSNQHILPAAPMRPEEAVFSLGAVQAQDYRAALWAVGLRCRGATRYDVEDAIARKRIIRTWPLRHTLHFVSPLDVRWMLQFYPDEPIPKYQRDNELTEAVLKKGLKLISNAFREKGQLTYREMHKALEKTGVRALDNGMARRHIIRRAGREGIICFGSHEGNRPTFALLESWVPKVRPVGREAALAELASRYFTSHGPATVKDFVWWSGLRVADARLGIERARRIREKTTGESTYYMGSKAPAPHGAEPSVHLLPAFDEYLLGYSDRSAVLGNRRAAGAPKGLDSGKKVAVSYSNGIFLPTVVVDGQVVGTWKCKYEKDRAVITLSSSVRLDYKQNRMIREEAERYGTFLDMPVLLK